MHGEVGREKRQRSQLSRRIESVADSLRPRESTAHVSYVV